MTSGLLSSQGERVMPGGGYYGMVDTDDHKVMFSCHWTSTSYCNQGLRKVHTYGDGAHHDVRSSSLTTQMMVGQTTSIPRAVNTIDVDGIFGSFPTGTSVRLDVSNDGGTTWKAGSVGQKVMFFTNAGTSIKWRATLNGSASKTPSAGRRGAVLHHQLPKQRLVLRLPVHRFERQQRRCCHGGLERNTACRDLDHGQRRPQNQFLQLRYRRLGRAILHLAQHHQIDDRHIVLLLRPYHALHVVHQRDPVHHGPLHRAAFQCATPARAEH